MSTIHTLILTTYIASMALLCLFGAHRFVLMRLYARHRQAAVPELPPLDDSDQPGVLVQLPLFNERFVVGFARSKFRRSILIAYLF